MIAHAASNYTGRIISASHRFGIRQWRWHERQSSGSTFRDSIARCKYVLSEPAVDRVIFINLFECRESFYTRGTLQGPREQVCGTSSQDPSLLRLWFGCATRHRRQGQCHERRNDVHAKVHRVCEYCLFVKMSRRSLKKVIFGEGLKMQLKRNLDKPHSISNLMHVYCIVENKTNEFIFF